MSKNKSARLSPNLTKSCAAKDFLEKSGLSKKNILMLMNKEHWEEQLIRLIPIKKRVSCRLVFEICEEPLALLGRGAGRGLDEIHIPVCLPYSVS